MNLNKTSSIRLRTHFPFRGKGNKTLYQNARIDLIVLECKDTKPCFHLALKSPHKTDVRQSTIRSTLINDTGPDQRRPTADDRRSRDDEDTPLESASFLTGVVEIPQTVRQSTIRSPSYVRPTLINDTGPDLRRPTADDRRSRDDEFASLKSASLLTGKVEIPQTVRQSTIRPPSR